MDKKTSLIVIYNHNYESNIEKTEKTYKASGRFDNVFHLMPFYRGTKENVVKIFSTSYLYQEYIRQGLESFINDESSHYVFIADDALLNPAIDQYNIADKLHLDENTGLIPDIRPLGYETFFYWVWVINSIAAMEHSPGCEYQNFIPSKNEAFERFEKNGIPCRNITSAGFKYIYTVYEALYKKIL